MTASDTVTMRAAVLRRHGGPDAFEYGEIVRPEPGEHEILVKVLACALNHLDIFVRRGMPGVSLEFPHVSGGDIVGVVEKAGATDSEALVGTKVLLDPLVGRHALGENLWGGLAEYVVAPAANAISLDGPGIRPERYAALPIAYGTARRMLFERARLEEGETVLVLGATGGVGVACVQLATQAGARVIACSASDEKLPRLREVGAAEVVDARGDWSAEVWRLTERSGADIVIDYIGRETWPRSIRSTRAGGRLVTCGATTGYEAVTDLRYLWTRELDVLGSDGWRRTDLLDLVDRVTKGHLEPVIHGFFPLSQIHEAVAELEERRAFGKVIVIPDGVLA